MQIHEITLKPVAEGVLKNIGNSLADRVLQKAASTTGIRTADIMANAPKDPVAVPPSSPETDISQTLDDNTQYKFLNPDYSGISIIIRKSGYYIDRLPKILAGQIKKDPKTGLYPVLRPETIEKYNTYYDQAADRGQVKQEPIHAL